MSDPSSWPELHARRLDWAIRAQEDLVRQIEDDDVRWLYETVPGQQATGAARVAVLGPTQVGKTTVILRLLRLTEDGEGVIGRVLRGGRKQGQSASASAAIYGASPDDAFRYREGPDRAEEVLSEEDLLDRLRGLRERVEAGAFRATDAVYIGFPARCFSDRAPCGLRVIDLPGFDANSGEERTLTNEILERYLPLATLALLVERADNLASLGLLVDADVGVSEGWLSFPERYAVVLTRSVAAASVQRQVKEGRFASLADLQESYRGELVRALAPLTEDRWTAPELRDVVEALDLFPLDLGQSRAKLQDDVLAVAAPVLDEAEAALLERVAHASEPAGALALTAGLYRAAGEILAGLDRDHRVRLNEVDARITGTREAIGALEKQAGRYERAVRAAEARRLDREALARRVTPDVDHDGRLHNGIKLKTLRGVRRPPRPPVPAEGSRREEDSGVGGADADGGPRGASHRCFREESGWDPWTPRQSPPPVLLPQQEEGPPELRDRSQSGRQRD